MPETKVLYLTSPKTLLPSTPFNAFTSAQSPSRVQLFATPKDYSSSGSSPRDSPGKNTGVGCHFLLQGIFPTQGTNLRPLHCRWILYHWATGKPAFTSNSLNPHNDLRRQVPSPLFHRWGSWSTEKLSCPRWQSQQLARLGLDSTQLNSSVQVLNPQYPLPLSHRGQLSPSSCFYRNKERAGRKFTLIIYQTSLLHKPGETKEEKAAATIPRVKVTLLK